VTQEHRKRLRLRDYDYAQPGAYFITICTHHRRCLFGIIRDGSMETNSLGQVVADTWRRQMETEHASKTDEWILMPNHFHAVVLTEWQEGGSRAAPTTTSWHHRQRF
jgi:putative transposase